MIGIKAIEIRSGKKSWISSLAELTNENFHDAYRWFRKMISYVNRRSIIMLVQWIAYHILSWAKEGYIWLHNKAHAYPHSKRVLDMVKGKGEVNKNGGASIYLKRISDEGEEEVEIKK